MADHPSVPASLPTTPHSLHRRRFLGCSLAAAAAAPLGHHPLATALAQPPVEETFVQGPPPLPADDCFTIAVLPDTQNYSSHHPQQYLAQTAWLAEQAAARRIAAVLHLGDITNYNTPAEWEVARSAMQQLDSKVPYFIAVGNHDYSEGGRCTDRTTRFNDFFPLAKYNSANTFGGVYDAEPDKFENSFHRFSAGGTDYLVLALEYGPRNDVLRWANQVVKDHPNHKAILITHAYMYFDETRYNWAEKKDSQKWNPHSYGVAQATDGDVNDGEQMWDKLVKKHPSFIMTLNGHVLGDGLAKLTSRGDHGNDVTQMLVNFQMKPNGGDGWLRLLEVQPTTGRIRTFDYSPTINQQNLSPPNHFEFQYAVKK